MAYLKARTFEAILALVVMLMIVEILGCSSYQKTTTTTTQTATDEAGSPAGKTEDVSANQTGDDTRRATPETVTASETTNETRSQSHGLIGGLFYFIGEAVAFPFKVIGGIFDAIF